MSDNSTDAIAVLEARIAALESATADVTSATDILWLLITAILVVWMQAGFALVETGSTRSKNTSNILFKNTMDCLLGAIVWYLFGYAFAFGGPDDNEFIGEDNFALSKENGHSWHIFFFQWAFAATTATIVSGSVAERCRLEAYFVYVCFINFWIYPIIVHWVWDANGWMTMWRPDPYIGSGLIDFAGSGVVHLVGGLCGLMGAIVVGPRKGRFAPPLQDMSGQSTMLCTLGMFILWIGWYGFNCGSTVLIVGYGDMAARIAVTTSLGAAGGGLVAVFGNYALSGVWNLPVTCNGILVGLVSVTAGCAVIQPWAAIIIGGIGGGLFLFACRLLVLLGIDDPVDASPVHATGGIWGVIATGFFADVDFVRQLGAKDPALFDEWRGEQVAMQLIGVLVIGAWAIFWSTLVFSFIKFMGFLRVTDEVEEHGLDVDEHGGRAYRGMNELRSKQGSAYMGSFRAKSTVDLNKAVAMDPLVPKAQPAVPAAPASSAV